MKPDNVMLDPDGRIYLIDFGIARIHKGTGRGDTTCLGTRGYAAPEQFMTDAESDERTDIYNLGATLYHLLTGHMVDEAGLNPVPARYYVPSLSPGLEMILSKALQPDPAKRYRSAAAMKYTLDHYRELDRKFRIKACLTSAVFAAMTAAAAFMIISSLRIRQDADMLLESTRTDFIDMAKGATASEERMRGIIGAQTLDPESSDAMMLLLDLDTGDGNYTRGEDEEVRQILYSGYDDSRTYEEVMKANAYDYALFAYRLGIAYFYQYENTGNKQMAEKWFRIAANSGKLSESQAFRAEKLYSICSYYTAMGKPDETGDSRICYADYLDDLNNTVAGNIAAADNMTTALIIYKETAAEVYNNAWYFSREGVPRQESDKLLKEIETHLDTDFEDVSPASAERIKKMIAQTRTNIELATEQLDEAYAQSEN
jgi:serine/threonine-protein kinase